MTLTEPAWEHDVREGLDAMLAASTERPLAVLDWDDTCMRGDISETALALLERDTPGLVEAYEHGCRTDIRRAYVDLVHTLVAGRTPDEAADLADAALAHGLETGRIVLRPTMRELVIALLAADWEVCVVTASPDVFVRRVAGGYGIPDEAVLGMRSRLGPDGRFLPELAAPPTHFEGKLDAIRARYRHDPTFAAGDSRSDAPMMRAARYALLLDRGDPELRALAAREGWWLHRPDAPTEGDR